MAERYHQDVTELGRRVIQLEFKEKAQTPEIQKQLKEATRLRHIVSIRETLEGKKPGKAVTENEPGVGKPADGAAPGKEGVKDDKQKGAESPEGKDVAKSPTKDKEDLKSESKDAPKGQPVSESKTEQPPKSQILLSERDPRGLQESVELVKRLSGATAK